MAGCTRRFAVVYRGKNRKKEGQRGASVRYISYIHTYDGQKGGSYTGCTYAHTPPRLIISIFRKKKKTPMIETCVVVNTSHWPIAKIYPVVVYINKP